MKKVLIVNHYATPPMYGGLSRHHFFAKYLKKKGYEVKILASSAIHNSTINMIEKKEKLLFKEKEIDGVDYIYVKTCSYKNKLKRIFNMLQFYFRAKKVAKKLNKYDVVYSSTPQPLSALLGLKIAKKTNAESIVEVRDLWPSTIVDFGMLSKRNIITKVLYKLEEYMYKKADKLIFTIEGGKDYIKDQKYVNDINLKKVYHINNGIDLQEFYSNLEKNVIEDSDLEDNKSFKVIYAGSIRQAYNVGQILDVAKKFQDENYKNIKFLIYGKGPYLESLKERCINENINNVIFKGFVDSKYLPYILSKADVTLLQSINYESLKYGTSQNKLFTYLASSKPIISTMYNKYDLIRRFKCGITLKKVDVDNYFDAILKFYKMNKKEYKEYCDNCKKLSQEYDYEKLTDKLIEIIMAK